MKEIVIVNEQAIWEALRPLKDPELPAVTLVDMGIIRKISVNGNEVGVTITPTFAGCPAFHVMKRDIEAAVGALGALEVRIEVQLSPPWTSDWITEKGRENLREFGLAPPCMHGGNVLIALEEEVACPNCGSTNTVLKNNWGATPCRMIYTCSVCREPFERFKPL